MYLAFFPSPACAFFDFLLTVGILDVANREVVDREAMDGARAGATGAGIVGSDTPPTDVLAAKVADVASNARAEVCNPIASCARPHNGAVSAGDGDGSADMDGIDPVVGAIEFD
jgi:hypothetical protein